MDSKKDKKLFFQLIILIFPLMVFTIEIISFGIKKFGNSILPERTNIKYSHLTSDLVNGIRFLEPDNNSRDQKNIYIEKHGLAKTVYRTNNENKSFDKGLIITGNSVSLGHPLIERGKYKNTFVNLLENNLRENKKNIDIVNLSFYNFNSWEENVELNRYIISQTNHNDLPKINLVASIGGIQDFWGFIESLHNERNLNAKYHKAGGLMTWKNRNQPFVDFYKESYKASQGNIFSGFGILVDSVFTFAKQNSNTLEIIRRFKDNKLNNINLTYREPYNFNEITNEKYLLGNILNKKIKITSEEYLSKKNYVIDSTERNIKSMVASIPNKKFLFIYLPTRITVKDQFNIKNRYKFKALNIKDLHIIEKDYRNSLISKLSALKNIEVINMGDVGSYDWFTDESHFSLKGHQEITNLLSPIFLKSLNFENETM
tara:strand:+ start:665 stop:1954 length:1290 start_codon:yes stop_codon:yes gene_type:complete